MPTETQLSSQKPGRFDPEGAIGRHLTRRNFLAGAGAASAMALYSGEVARHELEVTERTVHIANLPDAFAGYRIIQISDLHLENYTEDFFLRRVIDRVNQVPCDLVLITGDYISKSMFPRSQTIRTSGHCGELLRALTCPLRYGVLGNHDVEVGPAAIAAHLRATGTPILENEYVPIERDGRRLWIAGISDPAGGRSSIEHAIPEKPDGPVIVMVHEPDFMDDIVKNPRRQTVDLVLAGHSHGGQIRLPHLPPIALPIGGQKYYEGLYRFGKMQLYVNRGIGTVGVPFRLFCPPEITVFTLQPHAAAKT
jgi:predicted MPP superfamily phosphohydrolase